MVSAFCESDTGQNYLDLTDPFLPHGDDDPSWDSAKPLKSDIGRKVRAESTPFAYPVNIVLSGLGIKHQLAHTKFPH